MKKTLFLLIAVASTAFIFAQNNSPLKLIKGQQYLVENKIVTANTIQMQGQAMDNNTDMFSTYKIEVTGHDGNKYNLTNTITNIKMNVSMMGQEMSFDSDKEDDMNGQMGSAFKGLINQPKQIQLDKSGKVLTSGSDSLSGMMKELNFDAAGFGSQLAFQPLPASLKKGTTWKDTNDDEGNSRTTTYTVTEINGNMATITFNGNLSTENTIEQAGMELKQKTAGSYSGEEVVDIKTGIIQTNSTTTNATGAVTAMGQDLPITTKVTSTTTVKLL
ncbi:MAG: DUF6263 family protein [Ginsengibacter sp.]